MGAKHRNGAGFVPMATTQEGNGMPAVKGTDSKKDITVGLTASMLSRLDGMRQEGESRSQQIEDLLDLGLEAVETVRAEDDRQLRAAA